MAGYNFPIGYQPAQIYYPQYNPAGQQQAQPAMQAPQMNSSIIWVQGESGAKSYLVAPNQTVTLWDSESQVIYLKSADASGMPNIKILDYTIRETTPQSPKIATQSDFATKEDINTLKHEIDAVKKRFDSLGAVQMELKEANNG